MLKATIHDKTITVTNIYAPSNIATVFDESEAMKEGRKIRNTLIIGDFNISTHCKIGHADKE